MSDEEEIKVVSVGIISRKLSDLDYIYVVLCVMFSVTEGECIKLTPARPNPCNLPRRRAKSEYDTTTVTEAEKYIKAIRRLDNYTRTVNATRGCAATCAMTTRQT